MRLELIQSNELNDSIALLEAHHHQVEEEGTKALRLVSISLRLSKDKMPNLVDDDSTRRQKIASKSDRKRLSTHDRHWELNLHRHWEWRDQTTD